MALVRVRDKNGNYIDIPALQGESAYDIAVRNGFVGTEQEWIESMSFANSDVLNKLGDSNGSLTYDGKAVGGRQTASVEINISDLLLDSPVSVSTNIYLKTTNQIPENSEIASVELNNGTIESPNWIDLRGMDALYPYKPYSVNLYKLNYSNDLGAYFLASITFFSIDKNALISSLDNYEISEIRVTYYL